MGAFSRALDRADAAGMRAAAWLLAVLWDAAGVRRTHVIRLLVLVMIYIALTERAWLAVALFCGVLALQEIVPARVLNAGLTGQMRKPVGLLFNPIVILSALAAGDYSGSVLQIVDTVWLYVLCSEPPQRPRRRPNYGALRSRLGLSEPEPQAA